MSSSSLEPLAGRPPSGGGLNKRSTLSSGEPLLSELPETTVGAAVSMKGELRFERLLRVDGSFEGKMVSSGDLVIGETGKVVGDIDNMNEVICDGHVYGSINVDRLVLRGAAVVIGDITCKRLSISEGVTISGSLNVHKAAPRRLDASGKPVEETKKEESKASADEPAAAAPAAAAPAPAASESKEAAPAAAAEPEPEATPAEAAAAPAAEAAAAAAPAAEASESKDGESKEEGAVEAAPAADAPAS